ncbi:FAD-dependent oxidoreductase [Gemmatimonas sp.]|uniref:glycerol-3-phosphate dehydrogenase/oxidase n=1 Tax=Gemmatimonas sp. TaxID=1962908 RepID=UPI003567A47E
MIARQAVLATLAAEPFDMLVVGGGITGAGVAREAALAGFRTALLERDDFASGTSSRSSRLVHGGVRYLEHGHIGLVFESSRERRLLLKLAPHLVRPLAFTWPVYRGARVPLWKMRAGLALYDALSLYRNARHHALNRGEVLAAEPALSPDGMVGGARYWDAATDDTRLTLASAVAARDAGASVANHLAVVSGIHGGDSARRLTGVVVEDRLTGATFPVQARVIINATGPWSDATAALTGSPQGAQVFGSAGSHIAVPRNRVGNNDAVTIVSPLDGRVMFILPAGVHTIIGTTERPALSGPDDIRATRAEVTYLLQSVNRCFPFAQLTMDDVVSAWCGIRPLAAVRAGEHNANSASREHAITHRADGLVSITGGKLTTYRAMAADVLSHARHELPKSGNLPTLAHAALASESTPLPGGDIVSREATVAEARNTAHDAAVGERLALAYGSRWRNVWSYVQRDAALGRRLSDDLPYLLAEVAHAVEREMAATFSDVLVRRTHVAFETRDNGRAAARRIAPLMAALLHWSERDTAQHLDAYDRDVARLFTIDDV